MTEREDWQQLFVSREHELALLEAGWDAARRGDPQMMVLLAPPGVGKTRLVQEFYKRLSVSHDGAGAEGYWPDELGTERDRISLSCAAGECDATRPMTMLWWAVKCVDSGSNGAASSDLLLAYRDSLEPHLQIRRTDAQLKLLRRKKLTEAAKGVGEVVLAGAEKAAELIPIVGPFVGLGKAIGTTIVGKAFKLRQLEADYTRLEQGREDIAGALQTAQESFEDRLIDGLAEFAAPADSEMPACPIILVVDDAQFADQDPALAAFLRRLVDTAWRDKWPLLLIMTHWTREWNERLGDVATIPGVIGAAVERGLLDVQTLALGRITDLGHVLDAAIPGLPAPQRAELLAKADGNARYLGRLIHLLQASPAMFEARKAQGAVHADALREIMGESFDLHDITRRLFDTAPEDARKAAALASIQGERFLHDLIEETLERLGQPPLEYGIAYCENPLAVVGSTAPGVGEFSQGVYREVARTLVTRLIDSEASVLATLHAILTEKLDHSDGLTFAAEGGDMTAALLLDLIVGLADRHPEWEALGRRAADLKGASLRAQGDLRGSLAAFQAAADMTARAAAVSGTKEDRLAHAEALRQLGEARAAAEGQRAALGIFRHGASLTAELISDFGHAEARWVHALMLERFADALSDIEGPRAARPLYEEYERVMAILAEERGTFGDRRTHAIALGRLGSIALELEGALAALPWFEAYHDRARNLAAEFDTPEAQRDLGFAHAKLGAAMAKSVGFSAAMPHFEAYSEITAALLASDQSDYSRWNHALALELLGDAVFDQQGASEALAYYRRYEEIARRLVTDRDLPGDRKLLGFALGRLGSAWAAIEGPRAALAHFQACADIFEALVRDLDTPETRLDLGIVLLKLGDTILSIEGPAAARPYFERYLSIAQQLVTERGTVADRRSQGIALSRMGDIVELTEGVLASLPVHRKYLDFCRAEAASLETHEANRDLAIACGRLGDALLDLEGAAAAEPLFKESLHIARTLAAGSAGPGARRDVAVALERLGRAAMKAMEFDKAEQYVCEYLAIADGLDTGHPEPGQVYDAAHARSKLAELLLAKGDGAGALVHLDLCVGALQQLVAGRGLRQDERLLEISHNHSGDALMALGSPVEAIDRYRQAAAIAGKLAAASPNIEYLRDVAIAHYKLGEAVWKAYGLDPARGDVEAYARLTGDLVARAPSASSLWDHAHALGRLSELESEAGRAGVALSYQKRRCDVMARVATTRNAENDWGVLRSAEDRCSEMIGDSEGPAARRWHLEGQVKRAEAIAATCRTVGARTFYADSLLKLGDMLLKLRDYKGALARYERLAEVTRSLADDHPAVSTRWKWATSQDRIGETMFWIGGRARSLPHFRHGEEELERLLDEAPSDALRTYYKSVRNRSEQIAKMA